LDTTAADIELISIEGSLMTLRTGNKLCTVYCKRVDTSAYDIWINDKIVRVIVQDLAAQLLEQFEDKKGRQHSTVEIKAPMPGLVTGVAVEVGQVIEKGARIATLEAMKMENEIRSPFRATIRKLDIAKGSKVEKDQRLAIIEAIT
jgi:biotin carboxyl carrier protein